MTNKSLKWESDNEKVAIVSNGKVTGIAEGNAIITVTTDDGGYIATCKVTVTKKATTSSSDKDTTTAKGVLLQTGVSMTITISLIAIILVAIFMYKRYNNYKDIK